uniref:Uncharacterized protein n=1 Tax=Timema bartmani TaxID=61472 RepID=A0A7R9FAT6_9NEOP|nr:unnamed protein product [Timema bartmani]
MEIHRSEYEQDFDQIAATKIAEQPTSTLSSQKMNTTAVLPRASIPQPQISTQPSSQTQQPLVSINHHHNPYQQYSSANTQPPQTVPLPPCPPHPQYQQGFHQPYSQYAPQHSYFQPYPYHVQRHDHSPQHSTDNITAHQVEERWIETNKRDQHNMAFTMKRRTKFTLNIAAIGQRGNGCLLKKSIVTAQSPDLSFILSELIRE